jgi:hypothetical protein
MKYRIVFIQLCLLAMLVSCHKEKQERTVVCNLLPDSGHFDDFQNCSGCTSDLCQQYQTIWKELFMEKNNLSESFFDSHILLCRSDTTSWDEGISFTICYKVKIDWAEARNCDQFIIKIAKGNMLYPSVDLPRDELFSKDEIRTAINHRVFSSRMDSISDIEVLKFSSLRIALDQLIKDSNVNTLCSNEIFINDSGNISLRAYGEYEHEINACISGEIDLINGNSSHSETPCWINMKK